MLQSLAMGASAALKLNPTALEVVYRDSNSWMGIAGNVLVSRSLGTSSFAALDLSYKLHEQLRARYPKGFAKLVISRGGSRMPSADERTRINKLASDFQKHTLGIALVFEGDGVWLSSMRVVTRAMLLAIPQSFPRQIFSNHGEAVAWLAQQCGMNGHFDPSALIREVADER